MLRTAFRRFATNASTSSTTSSKIVDKTSAIKQREDVVPDVLVTLGIRMDQVTFVSHPGVMAVSKLLEMRTFVTPRTIFTQENVDAIKEFDEILAEKAQIALDNKLPINFLDLEHIHQPEVLDMLMKEKHMLEDAREEVLNAPKGVYNIPKSLDNYKRPEIPRALRPELSLDRQILQSTEEGKEYLRVSESLGEKMEKSAKQLKGETQKMQLKEGKPQE